MLNRGLLGSLLVVALMLVVPSMAGAATTATVSKAGATITVTPVDDPSCDEGQLTIEVSGNEYEFVAAANGACGDIDPGAGCTDSDSEARCLSAGVTLITIGADPDGQNVEVDDSEAPVIFDFNGGPGPDNVSPTVNGDSMPGADTLDGADGDDELLGGDGGDIINGGVDNDDIDGGEGGDTIDAGPDADGFATGDDILGGAGIDDIDGGTDGDELKGGADGDTLNGGGGADTLQGEAGTDTVNGGTEADELNGGTEADTLTGDAGNDELTGGDGPDELNGSEGSETSGDTALYDDKVAAVTADIGGANDDGNSTDGAVATARDDIHSDVENIIGGAGGDTLTGDTQANQLIGNAGNDTFRGSAASTIADGADTFTGNADDDRVTYFTRGDDLDIDADGVADDGAAAEGDNVGVSIEDISGGGGDDDITGSSTLPVDPADRDIDGGAGDDDLKSSTAAGDDGADEFTGGTNGTAGGQNGTLGDTVSYIDRTTNVDVDIDGNDDDGAGSCPEAVACEDDDVHIDVENVTGGDGGDSLIGDSDPNRLLGGNGGSDELVGSIGAGPDGADVFSGGAHVPGTEDSVTYQVRADNITADIDDVADDGAPGEGDNVGNSIENLTGGSGNDALTALGADNDLRGGPGTGNDTLNGGNGDDVLRGGLSSEPTGADGTDVFNGGGNTDLVTYGPRADDLVIDIGGGADDPEGDNIGTDVENLQGGDGDDLIIGDAGPNTLIGDIGSDTLQGGALDAPDGVDVLNGSSAVGAVDTVSYAHRSADLDITFDTAQATDGTHIDTLQSIESATGSSGDNTIIGDDGNNVLNGGPGDDTLNGGFDDGVDEADGADTYIGGEGNESDDGDLVNYGHRAVAVTAGIGGGADQDGDQIQASVEGLIGGQAGDTLAGDGGPNLIEGLEGGDTMTGGGSADNVTGGTGADTFHVRDGISDTVDCGDQADIVNGDQTPPETFISSAACETKNLANLPTADLSLAMTASATTANVGQQVTFTLTVSTSAATTNVTITDVLPAGFTYVSDTPDAAYDQATGVWNAGSVASATPESITIVATKSAPGAIQNAAEIATAPDTLDPDSTPNNGVPGEDDLASATITDPPVVNPPGGGGVGATGGGGGVVNQPAAAGAQKKCKKGQKLKKGKCVKKKRKK